MLVGLVPPPLSTTLSLVVTCILSISSALLLIFAFSTVDVFGKAIHTPSICHRRAAAATLGISIHLGLLSSLMIVKGGGIIHHGWCGIAHDPVHAYLLWGIWPLGVMVARLATEVAWVQSLVHQLVHRSPPLVAQERAPALLRLLVQPSPGAASVRSRRRGDGSPPGTDSSASASSSTSLLRVTNPPAIPWSPIARWTTRVLALAQVTIIALAVWFAKTHGVVGCPFWLPAIHVGLVAGPILVALGLTVSLLLTPKSEDGPSFGAKWLLGLGTVAHLVEIVTLGVFLLPQAWTPHALLPGQPGRLDMALTGAGAAALTSILWCFFGRSEFKRNAEETVWTTIQQIQDGASVW